jgi:hypothetical protein
MRKALIVTASDANLYWLLKGLVLSTTEQRARRGIAMACLDLGLAPDQRHWLIGQGVRVEAPPDPIGAAGMPGFKPYMLGQLCRPFLPEILPGHDGYIWLDADVWVQQPEGLDGLLYVMRYGLLGVCPELHVAYKAMSTEHIPYLRYWWLRWSEVFGEEVAERFAPLPMLNSGVVAIPADHPMWSAWQDQLRIAVRKPLRHLSEQFAFILAAQDLPRVERLQAHWNWLSHMAMPPRHPKTGLWVDPGYPHQPIHILHLPVAHLRRQYLRRGMLYRGGAYLEDGDLPPDLRAEASA